MRGRHANFGVFDSSSRVLVIDMRLRGNERSERKYLQLLCLIVFHVGSML